MKKGYKNKKAINKRRVYKKKGAMIKNSPFPYKVFTKLKYVQQISLDPAAGSFSDHTFRANDCFDPDFSGAGHQPRGFDQWMANYSKFVVVGSKMTVKASTNSTGSIDTVIAVRTNTLSTSPGSTIDFLEDRKNRYKILAPNASEGLTLSTNYSHKTWLRSKPLTDDTAHGNSTGSPTNLVYFQVLAGAMDVNNPAQVDFVVEIDYLVCFFDPLLLPES